jgi:hypothetical protein
MIDGLALGETTPGPLIMVVTFVSFVGGYVKAVFGPDSLLLAGAAAATPVTWFTFLPFFVFILMGGPCIETTHNDLKLTESLTVIIAAGGRHPEAGLVLRLLRVMAKRASRARSSWYRSSSPWARPSHCSALRPTSSTSLPGHRPPAEELPMSFDRRAVRWPVGVAVFLAAFGAVVARKDWTLLRGQTLGQIFANQDFCDGIPFAVGICAV